MRKIYQKPETCVLEVETFGMLCLSTGYGDADKPALSRGFTDWDDEEDDWEE